jgi:isoleucyl-tRNA synthetase
VGEATEAYEATLTVDVIRAFEAYMDDLSNWYIRRSRRRFWDGDEAAFGVLWFGLVQALRVLAPVTPFLAEHLWRKLVPDGPDSIFLAGWPEAGEPDAELLAEVAEVRRVVELGRQARAIANLKLRQPLRQLVVYGAPRATAHADEIAEELRVEKVAFEQGVVARVSFKPNLPLLGPRLGARLPAIRSALADNRYELQGDNLLVEGEVLTPEEVLRERHPVSEGWIVVADGDVSVELDPRLDEDLLLKGRVLDRIHTLNSMRKEQGLELSDRIVVTLPAADEDLLEHAEWIKNEVLAVELRLDGELRIDKA